MSWLVSIPARLAKGALARLQRLWYGPAAKPDPIIASKPARDDGRERDEKLGQVPDADYTRRRRYGFRRLTLNRTAPLPPLVMMQETRQPGRKYGYPLEPIEPDYILKRLDLRQWKHKGRRKKRGQPPAQLRHIYTLAVNRRLERTLRKGKSIYDEISRQLSDRAQSGYPTEAFFAMLDDWATLLERFTEELVVTQIRYTELCAAQTLLSSILSLPGDTYTEGMANNILHFWNRARKDFEWTDARQKLVECIGEVRRRLDATAAAAATIPSEQDIETPAVELSPINPELKTAQIARLDLAMATVHFTEILLSEFRLRMFYRNTRDIASRLDLIDDRLWLTSHLDRSHDYIEQLDDELLTILKQIRHLAEQYAEVSEMAEQLVDDAEAARRGKMRIFGRPRRSRYST